jgi:hypothetical protein
VPSLRMSGLCLHFHYLCSWRAAGQRF